MKDSTHIHSVIPSGKTSIKLKEPGFNRFIHNLVTDKYLYIMFFPVLVFYIIFHYAPMNGLIMAFQNYKVFKGILGSDWVGLENFITIFSGDYFWILLKNTLLINIYGLVFGFPAPIILALAFNEIRNMSFKRITQTISYLPHFVSIVIITGLVVNFLSPSTGIANTLIIKMGMDPVYFMIKPQYFKAIYTIMNVWKEVGFGSVIYMAALSGIDIQLYEAAIADGANRWKQLVHITLPGLAPTIIIMLILKMGNMLTVGFESIINLYNPVTYESADVINTYVYRMGLESTKYSIATAVGFFQSFVGLILVVGANSISRRLSETRLW